MRTSVTAKALLGKRRQAERAWRREEQLAEIKREFATMPPEEIEAIATNALTRVLAGLRRDYHRLTPEMRRTADRFGVLDSD